MDKMTVSYLVKRFLAFLRKPKFHNPIHKSPPLVPIMSQLDPFQALPSYLLKIYFNTIFPLLLVLPSSPVRTGLPTKPMNLLPYMVTYLTNLIPLYLITDVQQLAIHHRQMLNTVQKLLPSNWH